MILSSMLMTPSLYTVCKTRNPNGTAMLYQLSLLVWGKKIGLSCVVLVLVKSLSIQHPEASSYLSA